MNNIYTENYFRTLNYVNYLDRRPKYIKHAHEIINMLTTFNLISTSSKILDYGCAVGFLMEGFKEYGYQNIDGYDISDWAISQCKEKGLSIVNDIANDYDCVICLDVFEHMTDNEISKVLNSVNTNMMLVRIPCSNDDGKTFHLEVSKKDPTHCNCKTKHQWKEFFVQHGYNFFLAINTNTIYDSDGVLCMLCFKQDKI